MDELYVSNVTVISNEFLSKYLSDTKPEYIKVFLFYLWKGFKEKYSIEDAADELDLTANDVEMALKFRIKKSIFKRECLLNKNNQNDNSDKLVSFDVKKKELINKNRKDYSEIEGNLLFVAEKLLGKTLSERQVDLIAKCYNEYGFDESVIHYLFEYCYNKSQTDARYMKAVAESWYEQNVKSIQEAKNITERFEKGLTKKVKDNKKTVTEKNGMDEYDEWFRNNVLAKKG